MSTIHSHHEIRADSRSHQEESKQPATNMKKLLLVSIMGLGLATTVRGQGTIQIANYSNTGGPGATTSGRIYTNSFGHTGILDPKSNIGVTLLAGTNYSNLSLVATLLPTANGGTSKGFAGTFADPLGVTYFLTAQGIATQATGYFELKLWLGDSYTSYDAAASAGAPVATAFFTNPTGNASTAPFLTGMRSMTLGVPEPGAFALAGLGAITLLIRRRWNSLRI
jgi:hypothetical protein